MASAASTSSRCTLGSSSDLVSLPSPTVLRPNSPTWSPATTIATSAALAVATASVKPDVSLPSTLQPCVSLGVDSPARLNLAARALVTDRISNPVKTSGKCVSTWFANELLAYCGYKLSGNTLLFESSITDLLVSC